jgi:hypothetical protein
MKRSRYLAAIPYICGFQELVFRTRLTLVGCQRPALAGMFSAFKRSAMVS